jgi:NAD-dependent SIR2 family protein deacetylase/predicted DNA-binding transcriptional regulator YafY
MTTNSDRTQQQASLEYAAELVAGAGAIILAAGAGMGVDSGLPDFRGDEGFWRAYPALRAARLGFQDMADPAHFAVNPRQAWGFYGHRLALYRKTQPHQGFALLRRWMEGKPQGYSIFTSNVDGQFAQAGFASDRLHECHGSIHHLQCTRPCSQATWSAEGLAVEIDEGSCTWLGQLPTCPHCGALARPNILMFNDSSWVAERSDLQAQLQSDWLARLASPLVIEIGAGTALRTVRNFSRQVVASHNGRLIRINPDGDPDDSADVVLAMPALSALRAIDRRLSGASGPRGRAPGTPPQAAAKARSGKQHAEQTLRRRLQLLALLPSEDSGGIGTGLLTERLNQAGYACVRRTVERDLLDIFDAGPVWRGVGIDIVSQADPAHARRRLWAHKAHSKTLLLRSPSSEDALLIGLLAQELQAFLPASALPALSAYQLSSDRVMELPGNGEHARYRKKICSLPDGPPMCPPRVDASHFRELNEALLREEQVDMRYHAAGHDEENDYRLHPVGLVKKGRFFWLLAAKEESGRLLEDVRTFRMDRVRSIRRRANDPVAPRLPLLVDVLNSGVLEFFPAGKVALLLHSAPGAAGDGLIKTYKESPFGADQQVSPLERGGYQLSATVRYSRELVWALQGQAHLLRVVAPAGLREELERFTAQAAAWYGQAPALSIESASPNAD